MKRILISLIIVLFIFILYSYSKITNKKDDLDTITLSEVTHSVFYAPFYVSIEKGYFKEEGININLVLTPGADKVASSVLSNDANIGLSGPEATIYIYNNSGKKLLTFASLTKKDGQFIVGDCSLKNNFTMNDLKNKTILAGRSGGMPLLMFEYALKESNVEKKLVTIDTSVEFANLSSAYIANNGDFVNLFEPNASTLEKKGYGCVLSSLGNVTGNVPYTTFYAKEEYINDNKDLIKRFNRALNKGLEFVSENDAYEISKIIHNQFIDTDADDLITYIERYKEIDSWYKSTYINVDDYNRLVNIMLYGKTIKKRIDPSILLTNEFN